MSLCVFLMEKDVSTDGADVFKGLVDPLPYWFGNAPMTSCLLWNGVGHCLGCLDSYSISHDDSYVW